MDKILHDPKDPKLWELWYIPYYGSCKILSINRCALEQRRESCLRRRGQGARSPLLILQGPTLAHPPVSAWRSWGQRAGGTLNHASITAILASETSSLIRALRISGLGFRLTIEIWLGVKTKRFPRYGNVNSGPHEERKLLFFTGANLPSRRLA